jgi:TatD DNase family protein
VPVPDSHTHLDLVGEVVGGTPADGIAAARAVGVDRLVQVGVDLASSRWGAELARTEPAVLATVALHPNEAPRLTDLDQALRSVEELAGRPEVRAVGRDRPGPLPYR